MGPPLVGLMLLLAWQWMALNPRRLNTLYDGPTRVAKDGIVIAKVGLWIFNPLLSMMADDPTCYLHPPSVNLPLPTNGGEGVRSSERC